MIKKALQKYHYHAFGLAISSSFPIPELGSELLSHEDSDISIRYDIIPDLPLHAKTINRHAYVDQNQIWLFLKSGHSFWVSDGKEIVIKRTITLKPYELRFHLLGVALVCALAQRNIFPLHGCALIHNGYASIMIGHAGTGKSTLAIGLDRLGFNVTSDDVCAITLTDENTPYLYPSYPMAKLGEKTLNFFNKRFDSRQLQLSAREKLFAPLKNASNFKGAVPVKNIYRLAFGNDFKIRKKPQKYLFTELLINTQRRAIVEDIMGKAQHFHFCSTIAQSVEYYEFNRPKALHQFPDSLLHLSHHVKENEVYTNGL